MSISLAAAANEGGGVLDGASAPSQLDVVVVYPTKSLLEKRDMAQSPLTFAIGMANASPSIPLPGDVLELLIASVQFAEAIMQLERQESRCAERNSYEALAELKRRLNNLAWSHALE